MGTIYRRKGSPYLWLGYLDHTGKRVLASSKKKRVSEAKVVLARLETAEAARREATDTLQDRLLVLVKRGAQDAARGTLTVAKAREYLKQASELATGSRPDELTVARFLTEWVEEANTTLKWAPATCRNAKRHIAGWIEKLGRASTLPLGALNYDHIRPALAGFPADQGPRLTTLRAALNHAVARRLIADNPAAAKTLAPERNHRLPPGLFTDAEIERILAAATDPWKGMVAVGRATGLRLHDIATLTWDEIDWTAMELRKDMEKTDRSIQVPLGRSAGWLMAHRKPSGDVFPSLKNRPVGSLSVAFAQLMRRAEVPYQVEQDGKVRRRTFHSLRHGVVTGLMEAGIDERVARALVGHMSSAVHAKYTHIGQKQRADAMEKAGF